MPEDTQAAPVQDSVPKVDNKIAVGENLDFQRKWWRFERIIWTFFFLLLIADGLGLFGRGWLSKATQTDSGKTLSLDYERIERASTPSIMTLHFGPNAIHAGHIQVYVSESVIRPLGAQRISPQPATSVIGSDGITYTFDATQLPATAEIQLQPSFPGRHPFHIQVTGGQPVEGTVLVVP
jgi:hypothetical protein